MIKAFISFSFEASDHLMVEHFLSILREERIEPVVALPSKDVALTPPAEKIRTNILQSDCLIVFVTKPSGWIHSEIGMAYMACKPISVFSTEKIENIGGIAPGITDVVIFDPKNIDMLRPAIAQLHKNLSKLLLFGAKMEWYGQAVYEIIAQITYAQKIDIIGRSTITFFDALNASIRDRIQSLHDNFELNVYFVPADDSDTEIRPSAKLVLPKWRKRYPKTKFFVLPRRKIEIRSIIFDRDTKKDVCFASVYTQDDQGIYSGVTQVMERCDRTSLSYQLVKEIILLAIPYIETQQSTSTSSLKNSKKPKVKGTC